MITVAKKDDVAYKAYRLGESNPELDAFFEAGLLKDCGDGYYEIVTLEVLAAGSGKGEVAHAGDWLRVGVKGELFPNTDEYFRANMVEIGKDTYKQLPIRRKAWTADCEMCPEVEFLIKNKGLVLDWDNPDRFFSAPLWGTVEAAAKDAFLVFYELEYDNDGNVTEAYFNFVDNEAFEQTYEIIE